MISLSQIDVTNHFKSAVKVIEKIVEINEWQPAGLYNINVPLVDEECSVKVTSIYQTTYGSLFKPVSLESTPQLATDDESVERSVRDEVERGEPLEYRFAPDYKALSGIPDAAAGTDTWAVHNKHISGQLLFEDDMIARRKVLMVFDLVDYSDTNGCNVCIFAIGPSTWIAGT